jgi:hypothetical protein
MNTSDFIQIEVMLKEIVKWLRKQTEVTPSPTKLTYPAAQKIGT